MQVTPDWMDKLPLMQQAVVLMAIRGPDAFAKMHACKPILWYYRACVLKAAHKGRMLEMGEHVPSLMTLRGIDESGWRNAVHDFFQVVDELPLHYFTHFMHGVQVLAYKHSDDDMKQRWLELYCKCCDYLHVPAEAENTMDHRLSDFGRPLETVID